MSIRKAAVVGCAAMAAAIAADGGVNAEIASPEATMDELEQVLLERVGDRSGIGIVAGVVFPDGHTRTVTVGEATPGEPLSSSTVFEIGSITKVFTATLLADMVQAGEVKFDDPVQQFLPDSVDMPTRDGRQITLVDLATQTSGLPRLPDNFAPTDPTNPYADYTVDQLYEFLSGYELTRDIGSEFEYSNLGVGLLGHVLALQAGVSYEALVSERVLEPLGMTTSGITIRPDMTPHLATGHNERDEAIPYWDLPTLAGAGALRSNLDDMLRFAEANLDTDAGPLQLAMAAAQEPRQRIDPQTEIGLNWFNFRPHDRTIVWHNGGTGGFLSFIGLDQATGTAVVVLSNSVSLPVDDIGLHLLDERIPLVEPIEVPAEISLPAAVLEQYVGEYELAGETVTIALTPDGLVAETQGQVLQLSAGSESEFFVAALGVPITFQFDSSGAVTGFILHQGGEDVPATKIG